MIFCELSVKRRLGTYCCVLLVRGGRGERRGGEDEVEGGGRELGYCVCIISILIVTKKLLTHTAHTHTPHTPHTHTCTNKNNTCTFTHTHNTHTSHIHNAHNTHNTHNTHTSQMHNTQHTSHRAEHSNTFLSGGMEEFIFRFGKFLTIEDHLDCFESKLVIGGEFGTSVDTRWYL